MGWPAVQADFCDRLRWFFSVIDVSAVLTESAEPRRYCSDLKRKLKEEEGFIQLYDFSVHLKKALSDRNIRWEAACHRRKHSPTQATRGTEVYDSLVRLNMEVPAIEGMPQTPAEEADEE